MNEISIHSEDDRNRGWILSDNSGFVLESIPAARWPAAHAIPCNEWPDAFRAAVIRETLTRTL